MMESAERRAERAKAQEEEEPDEEEEEQIAGEAEREEILISNVVECVGTLMKARLPQAKPLALRLSLPLPLPLPLTLTLTLTLTR